MHDSYQLAVLAALRMAGNKDLTVITALSEAGDLLDEAEEFLLQRDADDLIQNQRAKAKAKSKGTK
jgi:hypothetical protein